MKQKKKVNIKDVAARARVHASTVSRVLNEETRSMVSERVGNRIIRIAEEMGYARSPLASGLRTGKSYTIGVLIPDLTNPLFPPIVRGIERTLTAESYIAMLADSDNNRQQEEVLLKSMKSRRIDGLILATAHRKDAVVDSCIEDGIPLVLVNRTVDGRDVDSVTTDDALGIELAVEHLLEQGHSHIAYLGGPVDTSTGNDRYQAFRKMMKSGRFTSAPKLIHNCKGFHEEGGYRGMLKLLKSGEPFTAVVVANDLLALGSLDALREQGLECPRDISITGFNDMPFVDRLQPPLTSLRIPHNQIGVEAARLLLAQIREPGRSKVALKLEPQLMVRGSTAPLKAKGRSGKK